MPEIIKGNEGDSQRPNFEGRQRRTRLLAEQEQKQAGQEEINDKNEHG